MRTKISKIIIFLTLLSVSEGALSQEKKGIDEAAALHREYKFEEAIKIYNNILAETSDSAQRLKLEECIIQCENGISLLQYAVTPNVIVKKQFPTDNLYIHI